MDYGNSDLGARLEAANAFIAAQAEANRDRIAQRAQLRARGANLPPDPLLDMLADRSTRKFNQMMDRPSLEQGLAQVEALYPRQAGPSKDAEIQGAITDYARTRAQWEKKNQGRRGQDGGEKR